MNEKQAEKDRKRRTIYNSFSTPRPSSYRCHRSFSLTPLAIPFPSLLRVTERSERETGGQKELRRLLLGCRMQKGFYGIRSVRDSRTIDRINGMHRASDALIRESLFRGGEASAARP